MVVELGQIVYSKMGRDKGKYFVVVGIIDDEYVYIADGDIRKHDKPKKKKLKHLIITGEVSELIAQKLKEGRKVNNIEIKECLSGLCSACYQ